MKGFCNSLMVLLVLMTAISCEGRLSQDVTGSQSNGSSIKVNVPETEAFIMTKAGGASSVPARVFGSEDDDFTITEYVYSIDEAMAQPATKGTKMTTTGINQAGESFTVNGWGMVSPGIGKPAVLTNHIPELTASYSSSGAYKWPWVGGADPKWINESNLHIWSYYPEGSIAPDINTDDDTAANNTATFSYTPNGLDLLIAYNNEYRTFKTDAKGNHTYNEDGAITNDMTDGQLETFDVTFFHTLAAIEFDLSTQMKNDKVDVKKITISTSDGGLYTSGDCLVTGPSLSPSSTTAGTGGVSWTPTGPKGAIEMTYTPQYPADGTSIAGGYATGTGNGVLFLIPQSTSATLTITVEFCKYGAGSITRTRTVAGPHSWKAGQYYKYVFDGEIHVPGELLLGKVDLVATNFKFPDTRQPKIIDSDLKVKGVTKIGVVMDGYTYKDNGVSTFVMALAPNGEIKRYVSDITSGGHDYFTYNFAETDLEDATTIDMTKIYKFGLKDDLPDTETEQYDRYYQFTGVNSTITNTDMWYFVFDTTGCDTFNILGVCTSTNNAAKFTAHVLGIMVLEVAD